MEMGESIVGAYLRQVRGCDLVLYNERTGGMSELDVIGIKRGYTDRVWLCEVATHLEGLQYGNAAQNEAKISAKIVAAQSYASRVFGADEHIFELWCPRVGIGKNTEWMERMSTAQAAQGITVDFIYNERYAAALQELIEKSRDFTSETGEPAFRMLQIMTHLKGTVSL